MTLLARQSRGSAPPAVPLALVVVSVLVVAIKFINPILYYISERLAGRPIQDVPVMWDYWWPFYLLAAGLLYGNSRRVVPFFLTLAAARVLWCVVTLTLFFAQPDYSYVRLQWLFVEAVTLITMIGSVALLLTTHRADEPGVRGRAVSLTS